MLKETRLAVQMAKKSGSILLSNLNKVKSIKAKSPRNFVTNTDLQSERQIVDAIHKNFPLHHILTEEAGTIKGKSDYKWLIDPLDGTHNFIHRLPLFGVSIALEYKKELIFLL